MLLSIFWILGADGMGIEIQNLVDISQMNNFELIMRLSTNINSSNEFFTDVNGYQVRIIKKYISFLICINLFLFDNFLNY